MRKQLLVLFTLLSVSFGWNTHKTPEVLPDNIQDTIGAEMVNADSDSLEADSEIFVLESNDEQVHIMGLVSPSDGTMGTYGNRVEYRWKGRFMAQEALSGDPDWVMMPMELYTQGFGKNILYLYFMNRTVWGYLETTDYELSPKGLVEINLFKTPDSNTSRINSDSRIHEFDHTPVFKNFNSEELFQILCDCLKKYNVSFSPTAEKHIWKYISSLNSSIGANARTKKLMAPTIYQQVIFRESGLTRQPQAQQVQLSDIETFKWNGRKRRIGF